MGAIDRTSLGRPARLAAVRRIAEARGPVQETARAILEAVAVLLDVPTASLALVDHERELIWATSAPERHLTFEHPLRRSLCALVVLAGRELAVADVTTDADLAASGLDLAFVTGPRDVPSYLGVPVIVEGGLCVGTVCVYGRGPQRWTDAHAEGLRHVAHALAMLLAPPAGDRRSTAAAARRLMAEHAAVRRVATIAAHADEAGVVHAAVVAELGALLDGAPVLVCRRDGDGFAALAGPRGMPDDERRAVCRRWTGAAADGGLAGVPVVVGGEPWGVLVAVSQDGPTGRERARELLEPFAELVAIAVDNEARRDALAELARTDPLSGLANRRAVEEELRRRYAALRRHGDRFAVALLDIDHFKAVNDARGHREGDAVLRQVAAVLRACTREDETVGRLGGDEFCVVLRSDGDQALAVAERLRREVEAQGAVTISVGVCDGRRAGDGDALLEQADRALYAAKAAGRNAVRAADTD